MTTLEEGQSETEAAPRIELLNPNARLQFRRKGSSESQKKSASPSGGPAPIALKLGAPPGHTQCRYKVKLSTRFTPGYTGLHR